jgi:NDP-sugar pyrophosphorylase family protein
MGIYMANIAVLKHIPSNVPYGFDNLMLDLIAAKNPASIHKFDGYWLDIGRPDEYEKACVDFEKGLINI